ncbi:MAG: polysaccharide deacetylase family protein [Planctomycetaceae bacterium]
MKNVVKQIVKRALAEVMPASMLIIGGARTLPRIARPESSAGKTKESIALTFDDGPHPEWTPRLLDVMQEYRLQGTFFVIGQQAQRYPRLIERIASEGHALGNHSYTHSAAMMRNDDLFLEEVRITRHVLEDISGRPCNLVRPPKGIVTIRRLRELWRDRQSIVLWNVDPRDFKMTSRDHVHNWCLRHPPCPGDVQLWHDNHPWVISAIDMLMTHPSQRRFQTMQTVTLESPSRSPAPLPCPIT